MNTRHTLLIAALACLTSIAEAQVQRLTLSQRIQATFKATDLDKNGTLSPQEAAKAGIPARSFAQYDKNKDRHMASDEFQAYYQKLIFNSQAERARKAKEAEEKRLADEAAKRKALAEAKGKEVKPVGTTPGAGAKPATDQPAQPARIPAGNSTSQPNGNATQASNAGSSGSGSTPTSQTNPVAQPPANSVAGTEGTPVVVPVKPKSVSGAEKAGVAKAVKGSVGSKPPGKPASSPAKPRSHAEFINDEQLARTYVQRLLSKQQVSAQDASNIYQSLSVGVPGTNPVLGIAEWRTVLNDARDRVTALVRSGALTATEGRAMYDLFEERARRATLAISTEQAAKDKLAHDAKRIQDARELIRTRDARAAIRAQEEEDQRQKKEEARKRSAKTPVARQEKGNQKGRAGEVKESGSQKRKDATEKGLQRVPAKSQPAKSKGTPAGTPKSGTQQKQQTPKVENAKGEAAVKNAGKNPAKNPAKKAPKAAPPKATGSKAKPSVKPKG